MKMTNDEAQEWLLAQHNAASGPPDPARFGAAIRAIRAKAIADAKEWAVEPLSASRAAGLDAQVLALAMVNTLPDILDWEMHTDEIAAEYARLTLPGGQSSE